MARQKLIAILILVPLVVALLVSMTLNKLVSTFLLSEQLDGTLKILTWSSCTAFKIQFPLEAPTSG